MAFEHMLKITQMILSLIFFVSSILFLVFLYLYVYARVKKKPAKIVRKRKIAMLICLVVCLTFFLIPILFRAGLSPTIDKPIIYLYPKNETDISVKLGIPEQITHSYPKYTTGWKVHAKPDGTLTDAETGRALYSLYYESESTKPYKQTDKGFCIAGEDTIPFLEEKLAILGLNEREAEEFIIYWLPKLEANKYNYIRFATEEEITTNMPLNIQPKPDTTIRVMMVYKGLNRPVKLQEQELQPVERKGYTAVEWGGTCIN